MGTRKRKIIICSLITVCILAVVAGCLIQFLLSDPGMLPLAEAAKKGDAEALKRLLAEGADVNAKDQSGRTALLTASWNGHVEIARILVERGANVNEEGFIGFTPLMSASRHGHIEFVRFLLDKGALVNLMDNDGKTALNFATESGYASIVELLKTRGASDRPQPSLRRGVAIFDEALMGNRTSKKDNETSLQKYQEALAIFEGVKSQKWQPKTLKKIGWLYHELEQPEKALENYQRAVEIFRRTHSYEELGQAFEGLAFVYAHGLNQLHKSLECHEQALEAYRTIGKLKEQALIWHWMSCDYRHLGQFQRAIECCEKQLEILKKKPDVEGSFINQSDALDRIGRLAEDLGQYQKALQAYEQCREIKKKDGKRKEETWSLTSIGRIYEKLGLYEKGLQCAQESLKINESIDEPTAFH